jgi:aminocarboxymuconate-semialdehyde decarboxylase
VVRTELSRSPSDYLRNVYVDTASMNRELQLANLEFMGPERMLFGTDSPPLATPLPEAIAIVDSLPISDEDRENVLAGNARRLFKLD